eukprot:436357-Amorphochlora_amoeboformis.AAC.1
MVAVLNADVGVHIPLVGYHEREVQRVDHLVKLARRYPLIQVLNAQKRRDTRVAGLSERGDHMLGNRHPRRCVGVLVVCVPVQ